MIKAEKTLEKIEELITLDQGARFRTLFKKYIEFADDVFRGEDGFRSHLGASLIHKECERELWYGFRWAKEVKFSGSVLRLFNRGHLEEPRFLALLDMIGVSVWSVDQNRKQFRIKGYKGHYGGGIDAALLGVPDFPHTTILGEFKTHNDSSFTKLTAVGVREAKIEHYIQINQYMGYYNFPAALYLAVNKNTDKLHAEIVHFDEACYQRYLDRAPTIVDALAPPKKINNSPGWWLCRSCEYTKICHSKGKVNKTCRTCKSVYPDDNGLWFCKNHSLHVDYNAQLKACDFYDPITDKTT